MAVETATFYPELGDFCHQRASGSVPVCAVTTLNHDQILFSNLAFDNTETTNQEIYAPTSTWVISQADVYLQRFWATSTAQIRLTAHMPSVTSKPPKLPIYQKTLGGKEYNFRLQAEDEICIYIGYLNGIRPVIPKDIEEGRLLRVYTGVIDTLAETSTPNGRILTIACRDRVRYLMDTFVSLSPLEAGQSLSGITKALGSISLAGGATGVRRSDLILKVAQMGIGYIELEKGQSKIAKDTVTYTDELTGKTVTREVVNINGKKIERGFIQDLQDFANKADAEGKKDLLQTLQPPDYFYKKAKGGEDSYIPLKGKTRNEPLDVNPAMRFNIMTGRLGFETEKLVKNFSIENQIPIEFIKFLANQEPYPTEMFANHQDGQFYYTPRTNDASGLADPKRYYRTYYNYCTPEEVGSRELVEKKIPDRVKSAAQSESDLTFDYTDIFGRVDKNQKLINFKEEFNTAALKTNFIVANASPSADGGTASQVLHLAARPSFLRGREIAGRTMYIIDETIENPSEAAAVAASIARATAKELKSASMTILGDPSLVPGEICQVIGSALYPESLDLATSIWERHSYIEYERINNASYYSVLEAIRLGGLDKKAAVVNIDGTYENANASPNYDAQIPDSNKKIVPKAITGDKLSNSFDVLAAVTQNETSTIVRDLGDVNRQQTEELDQLRTQLETEKEKATSDPRKIRELEQKVTELEGKIKENSIPKSYSGGWDDDKENPVWRRSGFTQEPRTIWRVEGVRHSFGSKGFTTEVALLSAFN